MIKYIFKLVLLLLIFSCKSTNKIVLYKDKETMDKVFGNNNIKDFSWINKSDNIFDTLIFKRKKSEKIYSIINNLEKIPNNELGMGKPRYALVLDYNKKKDTLYFYDFNDENYKNEAYMVQNDITLKDTDDELKKYLFKHYKKFIKKEYYYLPNSKKENYYIKN
jgi:hypothetical protein